MSTRRCSDDLTTGPASKASNNDTVNSSIPLSDAKPAGVATSTTNRPLKQGLPLEHPNLTQPNMASSRIPAGDDKPDDQTTTTPNNSLSDSPPLKFADQSQCKFMTIPRELRIMIYAYVYEYRPDTQNTSTKHRDEDADRQAEDSHLAANISLAETAPPTKDAILPCRELYMEMRKIQIAAYRKYWTKNRFSFPLGYDGWNAWLDPDLAQPSSRLDRFAYLPEDPRRAEAPYARFYLDLPMVKDLRRIRHFCGSVRHQHCGNLVLDHHILDIVFELGKWHTRVLSSLGKPLGPGDEKYDRWLEYQYWTDVNFQTIMAIPMRPELEYDSHEEYGSEQRAGFDPRKGEGLFKLALSHLAIDIGFAGLCNWAVDAVYSCHQDYSLL